jgi:D-amino-acid dehydrogenase
MAALKAQCEALGVKFQWETEVQGFQIEQRRIVAVEVRAASPHDAVAGGQPHAGRLRSDSEANQITGDEFILCGGSWSPTLAHELGLQIPMQAGKGYSLTLPKPRQLPQLCSIFTEARIAVTPMGDTLRIGGTMEIAGLNEDINPVRVQGIIKAVPRYFPQFKVEDFAGVQPWRGLRPCSPDGLPYLGRTAKFSNLTLATGHAMMGLSLGPITGKLVAALISDENPPYAIQGLNPDRYA